MERLLWSDCCTDINVALSSCQGRLTVPRHCSPRMVSLHESWQVGAGHTVLV